MMATSQVACTLEYFSRIYLAKDASPKFVSETLLLCALCNRTVHAKKARQGQVIFFFVVCAPGTGKA